MLEEVVRVPLEQRTQSASQVLMLEATVFRTSEPGRHPLVVISHGAIGAADKSPRWRPVEQARWFVARGFVVVVPMRRGNANSEGEWAEGFGPCESANYFDPSVESAKDLVATIDWMAGLPYVDSKKVLLVGHSAGGFSSLAAAAVRPVVAVFDFAGGRGSLTSDGGLTRTNCSPRALVETTRRLGETVKSPTYWFYAENDHYFPPALAHNMFAAFQQASKKGTFVSLPSFESEGHHIFWKPAAMNVWTEQVDRILHDLGLSR